MATIYTIPNCLLSVLPTGVFDKYDQTLPPGGPPPGGPAGSSLDLPYQVDVRLLLTLAWYRVEAWESEDEELFESMHDHIGQALALAGGAVPEADMPPISSGEVDALKAQLEDALEFVENNL